MYICLWLLLWRYMYMDYNVHIIHVFALYFQVPVNHQVRISVPVVRDGYLLMPERDSTPASRLLEELEGESHIHVHVFLHILCVHVHVCTCLLVIHVHPVYCVYIYTCTMHIHFVHASSAIPTSLIRTLACLNVVCSKSDNVGMPTILMHYNVCTSPPKGVVL